MMKVQANIMELQLFRGFRLHPNAHAKHGTPSEGQRSCRAETLRGQANIMEYILMTFFIVVVIIGLMLFMSSWQSTQHQLEIAKENNARALELTNFISTSPYFIKGSQVLAGPMLDDAKIMALSATDNICDKLENMFGSNWFAEISIIEYQSDEKIDCTTDNYPNCNTWTLCDEDHDKLFYVLPVNIYRRALDRTDIGTLKVGIYVF